MSRRQQSVLTVVLILALVLLGRAPVRAAEATMTFTGALNVVGLLSAITVQPTSVTVPAGSEVAFVNATSAALTVRVGGKSTRVEPGGSASMLFTGADRAESFDASATAVNLPVVGALTSSVGRVTVQAIPVSVRSAPSAEAEPTAPPTDAAPTENTRPSPPGSTDERERGAVIALGTGSPSPRVGGSGTPTPSGGESSGPAPAGPNHDAGSGDAERAGADQPDAPGSDAERADAERAHPEVEPVLPPFPGFSSTHDQLGLVFLLGAVVLAGLGTALFRTVLAFRPVVEVGAHSQAARKARKARRRRG